MSPAAVSAHRTGELERLKDERDFLLASIEDLEREHGAGDVDEADYVALRQDYVARAAAALRRIEALEAAAPVAPAAPRGGRMAGFRAFLGRKATRRVLGVLGICCVLGLVGIVAARFAGIRLPGETATGSTSLPAATQARQDLGEANAAAAKGDLLAALNLDDEAIALSPKDPAALSDRAWLLRMSGVAAKNTRVVLEGDAALAKICQQYPRYGAARALYGVALVEDVGRLGAAITQFNAALSDGISKSVVAALGPEMIATYRQVHQSVPAVLAGAVAHRQGAHRAH